MGARDIPNLISALRILLVVPVVMTIYHHSYGYALGLFVVAGVSDGLDGYLAKRFGWTSWIGGILDPIADKLLITGCFIALGWTGDVPVWVVVMVLLRDLIIVGGALAYLLLIERFVAEPTVISKINTVSQLILVLAVLWEGAFGSLPAGIVGGLVVLVVLTTVASGTGYVISWSRRARAHGIHRQAR